MFKENDDDETAIPVSFEKPMVPESELMRCLGGVVLMAGSVREDTTAPFSLCHGDLPPELSLKLGYLWWLISYLSIFRNAPPYETHIFRLVARTRLTDPSVSTL